MIKTVVRIMGSSALFGMFVGNLPAGEPTIKPVPIVIHIPFTGKVMVPAGPSEVAIPLVQAERSRRMKQPALTPQQVASVLERVRARYGDQYRPWFIYQHSSFGWGDGREHINVTVFFEPHERSARLCKGHFVRDNGPPDPIIEKMREKLQPNQPAPGPPPPRTYWHVSPANQPFSGPIVVPRESHLPFPVPVGVSEQETIELVDFVRTAPPPFLPHDAKVLPDGTIDVSNFKIGLRRDSKQPILRIKRQEGYIEVRTGVHQAIFAGSGQTLEVSRNAHGKLQANSVGTWYGNLPWTSPPILGRP